MALTFPNASCSYDATRRAVRFWGYESAMERSFFITGEALVSIQPKTSFDEAGLIKAFALNRDRIYAAATAVHARGRKGSYELVASDF